MRSFLAFRVSVLGVVALGTLDCHSNPEEPKRDASPPIVVADASPSSALASPPPDAASFAGHARSDAGAEAPLDPLCAAVLKDEGLDASALRSDDRKLPGPRLFCAASPTVAWAIRVDPADAGRTVRQTLIFAGADGARAKLTSSLDDVEWPPVLGRHTAMFDFDGDGVPEFFTVVPANVRTFTPASRNLVTYKSKKIAPYLSGVRYLVEAVSDLEGDGHGDLRISFALGNRTVCQPGDEGPLSQEFEAHGLPGGKFSLDDSAAAAFVARRCPKVPVASELFTASIDPARDPRDLSLDYVACGRLRGKSEDALLAELQTACAPYVDATKQCMGPCRHLPDAIAIAKFAPPVQAKDAVDAGP